MHLLNISCFDYPALPFTLLKQLEDLSLRKSTYSGLPLLPPTLKSLSLGKTPDFYLSCPAKDYDDSPGRANLKHLENLEIEDWKYPEECFLNLFNSCKGNLRRLALDGFHTEALYPNLTQLFDADFPQRLEVLRLPSNWVELGRRESRSSPDDVDAIMFAEHALNLQEIDLSYSKVTGVGIKALVHKLGKPLRKMGFSLVGVISASTTSFMHEGEGSKWSRKENSSNDQNRDRVSPSPTHISITHFSPCCDCVYEYCKA